MRINLSTFAILEWSDISTDGKIWIQGIEAHDGSIVWSSGVYNWANCGLTIIQFPLK
jgi:hypothetical protein